MHESALRCLECTKISRVRLDYESALGCMRVHLELAMVPRPSSPCDGSGNETMSDTRSPKIDF